MICACACCSLGYWLVLLCSVTQEASVVQNWSTSCSMSYRRRCVFFLFEFPVSDLLLSHPVFLSTWLTPRNHQRCLWSWPLQSCKPPMPLQRRTPLLRQRLRNLLWRLSEILSPSRCRRLGYWLLRMVKKMQALLLCRRELHCCKACFFVYFFVVYYSDSFCLVQNDKLTKSQAAKPREKKMKEILCPEKIMKLQHDMGLADDRRLYSHCQVGCFASNLILETGNCLRCYCTHTQTYHLVSGIIKI